MPCYKPKQAVIYRNTPKEIKKLRETLCPLW
jgi:hypothetical protein